jgi:hypothetical protein
MIYHMMSCDNVTARYLNNFIMDFLKIVNSSIIFIAQVISQNNIPHRSNCPKYYFAFQFYTKGIILFRIKHEMEIGQNQSVI